MKKSFISFWVSFLIIIIMGKNTILASNEWELPVIGEQIKVGLGGIAATNGKNAVADTRCRTGYYDINKNTVKITPTSRVKYGVFYYDNNRSYKGWSSWQTSGEYKIAAGTRYIRVIMGYSSDTKLDNKAIINLSQMIEVTEAEKQDKLELGGIAATNGKNAVADTRCRTGYYDINENTVKITPVPGVKYGVFYYDNNRCYKGWSSWQTSGEYKIAAGTRYIRVIMGYSSDTKLDNKAIINLSQMIEVTEAEKQDKLELGGIAATNGKNAVADTRCRTGYYDINENTVKITPVPGVKYGVFYYDNNRCYKGWSSWQTSGEYKIAAGTRYIRVIMGYSSDAKLDNASMNELVGKIEVSVN